MKDVLSNANFPVCNPDLVLHWSRPRDDKVLTGTAFLSLPDDHSKMPKAERIT
jgi:hypothetical protein